MIRCQTLSCERKATHVEVGVSVIHKVYLCEEHATSDSRPVRGGR